MRLNLQIDAFHASTVGWGGNSRPIQPRNGRSVVSYGRDGFYAVKSDFLDLVSPVHSLNTLEVPPAVPRWPWHVFLLLAC